jgi:hypothetical protein
MFYQDGGDEKLVKLFMTNQQEVVVPHNRPLHCNVSTEKKFLKRGFNSIGNKFV